MYFLISSRKESYFGATYSSFQDLSVNSEYLKGLGNFHDQSFESYFNTQAKIRFRLLKQFSTSVTWIGLPLFFLFYPILLGFLPANLRWTMFVFIKVNTALYPVSIPPKETAAKV